MRALAFLVTIVGIFVYLLSHMSFWAVFGVMYGSAMVIVAVIAFLGRSQSMAQMSWAKVTEPEQTN